MILKKIKAIRWLVLGFLTIAIQACAIPSATMKKPDTSLPKVYTSGVPDSSNTASVNWKEFFDDPDLLALIETAINNNKEVNIMLQRIGIAENEVQARKGEYMPFVGIGVGAETEKVGKFTRNGSIEENIQIIEDEENPEYLGNYQLGLIARWEIDIWRKLSKASQAAAYEYLASKEGRNFLVTNLVAEIANSYYELVALDNQLMNLDQNIKIQEKGIDVIKQLTQYGRANMLAVKRYEAEVSKNKSEIFEVLQKIVEVENRINVLLGRLPQPIPRSSGGFLNIQPRVLQEGIPSQLLQNRPDIKRAELELTAANLNIDVARANFFPSFEIKARYGYQAFDTKYLFSPESLTLSLAGELVAPLINRSAIMAEYKNADARQVQAAYEYEQTIISAYTEVSNKISNIDNLEKQYQLKSNQVNALTQSIELVNELFKAARADYLEILLTQRDALEAKMELIEIKQKQVGGTVDLYRALGGGWQ